MVNSFKLFSNLAIAKDNLFKSFFKFLEKTKDNSIFDSKQNSLQLCIFKLYKTHWIKTCQFIYLK